VDEIKAAGGDATAVGGDVAADDFPAKVLDATIKYAQLISPVSLFPIRCALLSLNFSRRYGKLNHIVNNGACLSYLLANCAR
jgi:hypothetical protein